MAKVSKKARVQTAIVEWIDSGRYPAGAQLPTEAELMEEFQVSRIVIREAIGNLVSAGRLLRRQGAGTFVTDDQPSPPSPVVPLPSQLAVMLPPAAQENSSYHLILDGIEEPAAELGFTVVVFNHKNDPAHARLGITRLAAQGIMLLIFTPLEISNFEENNRNLLQQANRAGMKVLLVDKIIRGGGQPSASFVGGNGYDGIRKLVNHLIELGHRRIGCIMNNLSTAGQSRLDGFRDALREHHLPLPADHCRIYTQSCPLESEGLNEAVALLSLKHPPTAVVCVNDWVARNFCNEAAARGIAIPGRISVTGFDDLPLAREMVPALTTAHQPLREIGNQAVELLVAEYTGKLQSALTYRYLNTEIVIRNSTATPTT